MGSSPTTLYMKQTIRILAVMPLWRRPALTRLILRQWNAQIQRLRADGRVDLHLLCIGSEGAASVELVSGYANSMSYMEHRNYPLNQKWNAGIQLARTMNPDAVVIVGSDDLLSDALWLAYADKLARGEEAFGLLDLWFFDISTQRLGYWPGYSQDSARFGESVGLGRCYSRSVLNQLDWLLWDYPPAKNTVLDGNSTARLNRFNIYPTAFRMDRLGPNVRAVDIKGTFSITQWDRLNITHLMHNPRQWLSSMCDDDFLTTLFRELL